MDEPALIRHAQRGDLDSFNRLVMEYQTPVYNVAYRILCETASAADATQEAFISAYKNIKGYRGGSFKGWLMRIVTNACYDELRRRKRKPASSLDALTDLELNPDSSDPQLTSHAESPEAHAERSDLALAIQNCLNHLPDDQRMAIVLCDVQEMDYGEIAKTMRVALGTVKSRIARARAKLRECFSHHAELLPAEYRLEGKGI